MIRRPLDRRFAVPVLARIKVTTYRERPWPVGVPIMLYAWDGRPYRSRQSDIAPVVVESATPIRIDLDVADGIVVRDAALGLVVPHPWIDEGFDSPDDFRRWFSPLVAKGGVLLRHAMRFHLLDAS